MRWTVAIALAAALLTGCSQADDGRGGRETSGSATFGLTQLAAQEGTAQVLVSTTNTGTTDLRLRSVAVDWPGFAGGATATTDSTIRAGRRLDVRVPLPTPDCAAARGEPVQVVIDTDEGEIRGDVTPSGATYLRRLWQTQCGERAVRRAVRISYSRDWEVVGEGASSRAVGDLVLRRRSGDLPVEVTAVDGSVLHGLRLPGVTTLEPGGTAVRIPLEITPGERCDEHARGQATAPFAFSMAVSLGDREPVTYPLQVPRAAAGAATRALEIACLARRHRR